MKKIIVALLAAILACAILTCTASAEIVSTKFDDVDKDNWYTDAIEFCYQNGYMAGISEQTFGTTLPVTRAMFAVMLAKIDYAGLKAPSGDLAFSDVPADTWYTRQVEWAFEHGFTAGTGNGMYSPISSITREALMVMLYKYSRASGIDTTKTPDISSYADCDQVHEWALPAVKWAVANNLISGYANRLHPLDNTTRAEIAVIIRAFCTLDIPIKAEHFTVSRAFGSDMILQRDDKLTVWGFAPESEEGRSVRVTFKNKSTSALVEDGKWTAVFDDTFPASFDPAPLRVNGRYDTVTFDDVMMGDVYYVIGQSNVYWPLDSLLEYREEEGVKTEYSMDDSQNMRFFRNSTEYYNMETGIRAQGTTYCYEDVDSPRAKWMKPSDNDMMAFSAYGYFIAYNLEKSAGVPIGMIEIDGSGLPLASFSPNELCDKWKTDVATDSTKFGLHYLMLGEQLYFLKTRYVFNHQINPLMNFSCAGILWYQGESDIPNTIYSLGKTRYTFQAEFCELMTYFRQHFGNSDFPVYMVEFPPCYGFNTTAYLRTGTIRSELGVIPTMLENCYVVSSSDFWPIEKAAFENNLHPYCKPEQGKRTADMILAKEYGKGDIDASFGPTFKSIEYINGETAAVITFDHVGLGLSFTDDEGTDIIAGFETLTNPNSYSNGWHTNYNVKITAYNQITITDSEPIYGVRYNAVTEYYFPVTVNVHNSNNVPMIAFADYRN